MTFRLIKQPYTPQEIADRARGIPTARGIAASVNRDFRRQDDSAKFPINGAFNATERAIKRLAEYRRESWSGDALEYALALDAEISRIVNGTIN